MINSILYKLRLKKRPESQLERADILKSLPLRNQLIEIGKLDSRMYHIENGQMSRGGFYPQVTLNFDARYEERVNGVDAAFIEYVDTIDVLRQLGYDPNKRIKHINDTNGWYFITAEWLHQVHLMDTGQSTAVTIHLDALTH